MPLGWYYSDPGAKFNSSQVQNAMDTRLNSVLLFPVYDAIQGNGANLQYRIVGWAGFYMTGWQAQGNNATVSGYLKHVAWEGTVSTSASNYFGAVVVKLTGYLGHEVIAREIDVGLGESSEHALCLIEDDREDEAVVSSSRAVAVSLALSSSSEPATSSERSYTTNGDATPGTRAHVAAPPGQAALGHGRSRPCAPGGEGDYLGLSVTVLTLLAHSGDRVRRASQDGPPVRAARYRRPGKTVRAAQL